MTRHDDELRLADWFCGAGGSTQAIATIPGVRPIHAANHWDRAIESHAANFPEVDHRLADIRDLVSGPSPRGPGALGCRPDR